VTILFGLSLLATALFGAAADGAARWIFIGPLGVQVSLVVVPFMIVAFAARPDAAGLAGIAAAALALAIQPDRAMAAVLALGMVVLLCSRPARPSALAALAAAAGFAAALARPEALPAVPFVDQILYTAFDVHLLAGAAVLLGSALLPVAAIAGWRRDPGRRHLYMTFASVWLGCILAAAVGNYPPPVVGYGGSFILGYLLSLAALPARQRASRALAEEPRNQDAHDHGGHSKAAFLV
jgi:cell division protein FtsW (lipid II flippase)